MRAARFVLVCALVSLAAGVGHAQTLDELNHPLLPRGGVDATAAFHTYAIEHAGATIAGPVPSWFQPQRVLLPEAAIGLGGNVQVRVSATDQFATPARYTLFDAWSWIQDTQVLRTVSADVSVRPSAAVQFDAGGLWGRAAYDATYTRDEQTTATLRQEDSAGLFWMHATWLPGAGTTDRPLRADLDGLRHPLLEVRRWRLDARFDWRSQRYAYRETVDRAPDYLDERVHASAARVRTGVAYGLLPGTEVVADAYWQPAFRMNQAADSLSTWRTRTVVQSSASSEDYRAMRGLLAAATWRRGRAEAGARGTWEHQEVDAEWFRTSWLRFNGAWLTRAPRRTTPRTGLAALDHPLLEQGQLMVEATVFRVSHDETSPTFRTLFWAWQAGGTVGLLPSLQLGLHAGALYSKHFLSHGGFDSATTLHGDLVLRVTPRSQVFATADVHPAPQDPFPMLVFGVNDPFRSYQGFSPDELRGSINLRVGVRLVR